MSVVAISISSEVERGEETVREMEELVPPSSPGMPPIGVSECLEELLKFTLTSSINETLEIDMGLSKDYCSNLIKNDPSDTTSDITDSLEGVPSYPLYKRLALALHQSITSGALLKTNNKTVLVHEDYSWEQKEDEWNKLVLDKGSELVNVLTSIHFELHVQEPFFSELKDDLKTIEGRCATGNYNLIRPGALILFNKCLVLEVQDVRRYPSFSKMLEAEILAEVLPGIKTIEEGVQIYRKFYSEEKERSNGVLAICVAKPATQPYISLASILSGLSYGGVQRLLGLMHTEGTIPEALPPPRSTLLSSFMLPYNLNVKGSSLTHGARALAKHANRSSDNYWGSFGGSVSKKNRLAMDVINNLLARCCWLNVHIVPPHGVVFEIRVHHGYGARWSENGTRVHICTILVVTHLLVFVFTMLLIWSG